MGLQLQGLCKTSALINPSWQQVVPVDFGGVGMEHTLQQAVWRVGRLVVVGEAMGWGIGLHQQNTVGVQTF